MKKTQSRKALAISVSLAVIGFGSVATLASWNDQEWVFARLTGDSSDSDDPGVGTSTFDIWQNRDITAPAGDEALGTADAGWFDLETNPGGALYFTAGRLALTPGDSIYAPVALQTKEDSVSGTLQLQTPEASVDAAHQAIHNDATDLLWNSLEYSVKVSGTQATPAANYCSAATWNTFGTAVATDIPFNADRAAQALITPSQAVQADRGNTQYYCFKITLPENPSGVTDLNDLQGRIVIPAWHFLATSD